jgi:uncharacterized protein YbjQ (UPF0145 family)
MPWWQFWKSESPEEIAWHENLRARAQEAIKALEAGDIPPLAKQRIYSQLQDGKQLFSSNFSVREFLLSKESGIEPISQVMGSCFYSASLTSGWGEDIPVGVVIPGAGELNQYAKARTVARKRAIQRMSREAELLGASGVIGVKLASKNPPLDPTSIEFTAHGTAVKIPGYKDDKPFTSNLSAQDFWQLHEAGYRPKCIVVGLCFYSMTNPAIYAEYRVRQIGLRNLSKAERDQLRVDAYQANDLRWTGEVEKYAKGFSEARNRAIRMLTHELYDADADGCVGMTIDHEIEGMSAFNYQPIKGEARRPESCNMLISFKALGTAIKSGERTKFTTNRSIYIDLRKERKGSSGAGFI